VTGTRPPTFGVEEEFLLLDPVRGHPRPVAPELLRRLAGEPGPRAELMRFQIETATAVCTEPETLRHELRRLREITAATARGLGCRLVAAGTSPYGAPGLGALTDDPRYRDLARRFPALTAMSGTCGCHVHVGVASRDLGVRVLARLRPWLAPLLALSVNSPLHDGRETGSASHRYSVITGCPTARPPGIWPDAAVYDHVMRDLIARGAALDEGSIYLFARLSPRFPTVEVRVTDVCPDVDTAVLIALLVRALVVTATTDIRAGRPAPRVPGPVVRGALEQAARFGPAGPGTETAVPVDRLLDHVDKALGMLGDRSTVMSLVDRLRTLGTGADRQLAAWRRSSHPADVVSALAAMTAGRPARDLRICRPRPLGETVTGEAAGGRR